MERRTFFRLIAAGLVAPVLEPKIKYFLPPDGGWKPVNRVKATFPQLMEPGLGKIYFDALDNALKFNPYVYEPAVRKRYLDERAENSDFNPKWRSNDNRKVRW